MLWLSLNILKDCAMEVACGQVPTLPIDKSTPGDVHGGLVHQYVLLKELLAT